MFIKVTRVTREMTEEATKKLEEFEKEVSLRGIEQPRDSEGRTLEWYETMSMTPPEELVLKSKNADHLELDLYEDYEILKTTNYINKDEIVDLEDISKLPNTIGKCMVTLKDSRFYYTEETPEQILELINNK